MNFKTTLASFSNSAIARAPSKETLMIAGIGAAVVLVPLAVAKIFSVIKTNKKNAEAEQAEALDLTTHRFAMSIYTSLSQIINGRASEAYKNATDILTAGDILDMDDVNALMDVKNSLEQK